jgi:hypothetical protein
MILAASAVLALGAPAFAQTAPVAPAAPAADAVDPAEAALNAKGEAFGARMQAMGAEMQAAITAAAGDKAAADTALDAIVARYQPDADAFSAELKAFFDAKAATATEEEKAEMATAVSTLLPTIQGVPAMVRGQMEQAAAAPAAPATPQ